MKTILILFLSCAFVLTSSAKEMKIDSNKRSASAVDTVSGHGEYVMQSSDTLANAYLQAERIAKADAARVSGQYYEVLNIKDSSTGEKKEIVASIAASISTYVVKHKSIESIGGQMVAKVDIVASTQKTQLAAAIKRYLQSSEYKERILALKKSAFLLNKALKLKEALVVKLSKEVAEGTSPPKLDRRLFYINKEIADLALIYGEAVSTAHNTSYFYDGDDVAREFEVLEKKIRDADAVYLKRLTELLGLMKYSVNVVKTLNPVTKLVEVVVAPRLEAPADSIAKSLLSEMMTDSYGRQELSDIPGTKILTFRLDLSPIAAAARSYSVIYVVNVNGLVKEYPIVMPMEVRSDKSYTKRKTHKIFGGGYKSRCHEGGPIQGLKEYDDILCFNYEFDRNTVLSGKGIGFKSRGYRRSSTLSFEVPIGEDLLVDTYFEIREVVSERSVYKKRF